MTLSRDLTYPLADNALCYWSLGILLLLFIKERKTIHLLLFTIYRAPIWCYRLAYRNKKKKDPSNEVVYSAGI